jgi:hypothetical protein
VLVGPLRTLYGLDRRVYAPATACAASLAHASDPETALGELAEELRALISDDAVVRIAPRSSEHWFRETHAVLASRRPAISAP